MWHRLSGSKGIGPAFPVPKPQRVLDPSTVLPWPSRSPSEKGPTMHSRRLGVVQVVVGGFPYEVTEVFGQRR
jgi:hypothetical protein